MGFSNAPDFSWDQAFDMYKPKIDPDVEKKSKVHIADMIAKLLDEILAGDGVYAKFDSGEKIIEIMRSPYKEDTSDNPMTESYIINVRKHR